MKTLLQRLLSGAGWRKHKYVPLGQLQAGATRSVKIWTKKHIGLLVMLGAFIVLTGFAAVTYAAPPSYGHGSSSCDTVVSGYQCQPDISHYWGQYSPYFSLPSDIPARVPSQCSITFAQVLSRHGARDPTASKTAAYNATITKLHANVQNYSGEYAFLADYEYTLGADQLTVFGEQELINSGLKFYSRYEQLARSNTPFVRSAGEDRVVESSLNWTQGFHEAKLADRRAKGDPSYVSYAYPTVVIPEDEGLNNTLNHGTCTDFEDGPDSDIASNAQKTWLDIFAAPIQARLNAGLPGANLSITDTINMMDLCPFNTVADVTGTISDFCALFTKEEWHQYGYYETLGKFYGYSYGNPLGPSQGVGWANELIARLTNKPVEDETTVNHTLDGSSATFPLGRKLYADFSHDNDMTGIFSALGFYNGTALLPNTTVIEAQQANGYSAAWTVPFAARGVLREDALSRAQRAACPCNHQ